MTYKSLVCQSRNKFHLSAYILRYQTNKPDEPPGVMYPNYVNMDLIVVNRLLLAIYIRWHIISWTHTYIYTFNSSIWENFRQIATKQPTAQCTTNTQQLYRTHKLSTRSRAQHFFLFFRLYVKGYYYLSILLLAVARFKYTQSQHTKLIFCVVYFLNSGFVSSLLLLLFLLFIC